VSAGFRPGDVHPSADRDDIRAAIVEVVIPHILRRQGRVQYQGHAVEELPAWRGPARARGKREETRR